MTALEVRASVSLASIFGLRMLGLFLILPVFAVHATTLPGGDNATLVGLAMGMYGLTQAIGQIPFGIASDRYGRKRIIVIGLLLFIAGSLLAAIDTHVLWVIVGRAVQGAGAVSAAVTALIADSTRDEHRTKAMALVGASIGLTYAASLVMAPVLYAAIGMRGMFLLVALLAAAAIAVVLFVVPQAPPRSPERASFIDVLRDGELMRMNFGVFALHAIQMSMFVVLPNVLVGAGGLSIDQHWKIYLPVVLASFVLMLPPIFLGEKRGRMKQVFVTAIALLLIVEVGLRAAVVQPQLSFGLLVMLLLAFFVAFNILEASQPSLVSRLAPAGSRGAALGVYNTMMAIGLFAGGAGGGLLAQHVGGPAVFTAGCLLTVAWLIIAASMKNLPRRAERAAAPT
ncbi:MAG: MFS transporter [Burkholderiaceae bacterium]|nr:MFS transporter [Burkholderiaceae bacterium]